MASGCSASDYDGAGSESSSQKFEEERLKHGARGEDRASAYVCKQITDSVYELYTPPTSNVEMEILFFHGLHIEKTSVPHLSTWRSRCTEGSIWPKHWLPEDYPAARVLTIAYDASLEKDDRHGRMDLYLVTESLLQNLLLANVGQTRPVVLVGHSFGGLVIKELCFSAHKTMSFADKTISLLPKATQKVSTFLQNIKGIFYYGTPHHGSKFPDFLEKFKKEGELVGRMKVLNKDSARLNQDFQRLCERYKWHIAGVSETQATDLGGGLFQVIVEEASSRCEGIKSVLEDHFSICRPQTKESNTYQYLVSFIQEIRLKVKEEISNTSDLGDFQVLPRIQVGPGGEIEKTPEIFSTVGLWGAGGIRKTTLSKAIFNRLHIKFDYSLFFENFFFNFSNLQFLHLEATDLECLPESFGSLEKLHTCALHCGSLRDLPISVGRLGNLQKFVIFSYKLESLPESFGDLGNLKELSIENSKLQKLPESFGSLGNLQKLYIRSKELERLPGSFGGLGNLQELDIGSSKLDRLPESFRDLRNLQKLTIWQHEREGLPEVYRVLSNLRKLKIRSREVEEFGESLFFRICRSWEFEPLGSSQV